MFDFNFNWFSTVGLNSATDADRWQVVIGILSLGVAVATLVIAIRVQKTIAANHAKQKQVEAMCNLVAFLNDTRIRIMFRVSTDGANVGEEPRFYFNLWEIGNLDKYDDETNRSSYNDCKVYLSKNTSKIVDIVQFINNPFIPSKIADALMDFYVYDLGKEEERRNAFVLLCTGEEELFNMNIGRESKCFALKSWSTLKTQSQRLIGTISEWFKDNKIMDFNLRENDYKYHKKDDKDI